MDNSNFGSFLLTFVWWILVVSLGAGLIMVITIKLYKLIDKKYDVTGYVKAFLAESFYWGLAIGIFIGYLIWGARVF